MTTPVSSGSPGVPSPAAGSGTDKPRLLDLLSGLPALIAVAGTLAVLAAAVSRPPALADYEAEYKRRLAKGDVPGAMVCLRRVVALNPGDNDQRFQMLVLQARSGNMGKADAIARSMAPLDDSPSNAAGHPLAHLYLAKRLMQDPQAIQRNAPLAERHLRKFIAANQELKNLQEVKEGKALLGEVYAITGKLAVARPLLEATAGEDPERLLMLAQVSDALLDRDQALRTYGLALKAAKARVAEQPDDLASLGTWAQAALNLRDYAGSIEVLKRCEQQTGEAQYRRSMAMVCAAWSENLGVAARAKGADPSATLQERIKVIEKGLEYDPTNPDLLSQLADLMNGTGEAADKARKILHSMLAAGQSPGMVHFFLGAEAWRRGQGEAARTHWEEAFKIEPNAPIIANNLAFVLAYSEPADPKRALSLVEQGLEVKNLSPTLRTQLRGTRGQVLVRLDRWKEALSDLESALRDGQNTPGIHSALAETYDHLQMPELAAEHRKAVQKAGQGQGGPK